MKKLALLALLLLSGCAGAPAFAQDAPARNCRALAPTLEMAQSQGWQNVVLRGPAVATWLKVAEANGLELTNPDPDFVLIFLVPDKDVAVIFFGKGDEICDPGVAPKSFVDQVAHVS